MPDFKTIVLLDLETTGLPHCGHVKITEMSFLACLVSHCQGVELPRVMNKLTICFNPESNVQPIAAKISGLNNELLRELQPFDHETVTILNLFLKRLPKPLCLIAHNGKKFDFPILQGHIINNKTQLDSNIYCADSIEVFKKILSKCGSSSEKNESDMQSAMNELEDVSWNSLFETFDYHHFMQTPKQKQGTDTIITTPKKKNYCAKETEAAVIIQAKRQLIFMDPSFENESNNTNNSNISENWSIKNENWHKKSNKSLTSFKLQDIYNYLHDDEIQQSHHAEGDCLMLLSCIHKCHKSFFEWLCVNALLLSAIEPLI